MADFNFDDYINKKRVQDLNATTDFIGNRVSESKTERLMQAARDKEAIIAKVAEAKVQNASSWSSQLGVQDTPVVGTAVDLAASFVSGASRQIGNIAGLSGPIINALNESNITDEDKAAVARFLKNEQTPEDIKRLTTPDAQGKTVASRYLDSAEVTKRGGKIDDTFNISSIVNNTDRNQLNLDLSSGYKDASASFDKGDYATGIGKLIYHAGGSILSNPKATSEYIAENLPQLLGGSIKYAGKGLLAASNIGYAAEEYRKGVQNFMDRNNGALPSDAERNKMALQAGSLALAEQLGEVGQLAAIGKATKAATSKGALTSIGKATGLGFAEEAATEGYQTYMEGQIKGEPTTGEDIYKSAVIGGASGGGLSGGGKAIQTSVEGAAKLADKAAKRTATDDAVASAISSGDTSVITDPKSPTYAPHRIVDVALNKAINSEVSQEEKAATFEQLDAVTAELKTKQEKLQKEIPLYDQETINTNKEVIAANADTITQYNEAIAQAKTQTTIDEFTSDRDAIQKENDELQFNIDMQPYANPKVRKAALNETAKQLEYLDTKRTELSTVYSQAKPEQLSSLIEEVSAPVDISNKEVVASNQAKVNKTITLAMANTGNMNADQIASLTSNKANGSTQEQREYFALHQKAVEQETNAKNISEVAKDIFAGGKGFIGLDQYRRDFASAFESNDQAKAEKLYSQLNTFAKGHTSKKRAMLTALNNGGGQIIKDASGMWNVVTEKLDKDKLKEAKGLNIVPGNTDKLFAAVTAEVNAIQAATKESYAALNVFFPVAQTKTKSDKGAVNETQSNQTTEAKQTEAQGTEQQPKQNDVVETKEAPAFTKTDEQIAEEETKQKEVSKESGKLSVLASEQYADKTIQQIFDSGNVVAAYIKQAVNGRPLVAVKDFFNSWNTNEDIKEFTGTEELSEKENYALDTLRDNIKVWSNTLTKSIKKQNLEGLASLNNLFNQLIKEDSTVDQNLVDGMAVAAYMFVGNYANYPEFRTDEELKDMFHVRLSDIYELSDEDLSDFRTIMATETVAINELGRMAADLLGLKNVDDRVPANILPKLKTSLGVYMLDMLVKEGVLTRGEKKIDIDSLEYTKVIYLAKDSEGKLNADAKLIRDSVAGSKGILEKTFKAETSVLMASIEPLSFTQKYTQNTTQEVAKLTTEVSDKQAKVPNKVIPSMFNLMDALGKDAIIRIAGGKDFDIDVVATDNIKSVETANEGLIREYELMYEMFNLGDEQTHPTEKEFYTLNSVQRSGRVGSKTRSLNMTTSKIHRSVFYRPSWKMALDLKDTESYRVLMTSLGTYLGFNPDTTYSQDVVSKLETAIQQKEGLRKAVNLIRRFNYPKTVEDSKLFDTQENIDAVVNIATGEDGMISLRALDTLASVVEGWIRLEANPDQPINIDIYHTVGIDGKVSATGLTNVSYGTADIGGVGARTGFYRNILNGPKNFVEYANPGNNDQYQHLTSMMLRNLMKRPKKFFELDDRFDSSSARYLKLIKSFEYVNGPLLLKGEITKAGRSLPKTPSTAFKFGSSIYSLVQKTSEEFIGSYNKFLEKKMTEYYKAKKENPDVAMPDSKSLIDSINDLIEFSSGSDFSTYKLPYMSMEELLNTPLSKVQKQHIRFSVGITMGEKMGQTFSSEFENYIVMRNDLTKAADLAHNIYEFMLGMKKEKLIQDGMDNGSIAFETKVNDKGVSRRVPLHDLTIEQTKKIEKMVAAARPVAHSPLSKMENNLKAGIFLGKGGMGISTNPIYKNNVIVNGEKYSVASEGTTVVAPGAYTLSALVHSLESSIMMETVANNVEAHHVYDEILVGVPDAMNTAKEINKHTAELIADYSPIVEVFNVLEKSILTLAGELYSAPDQVDQYLESLTPKARENIKNLYSKSTIKNLQETFEALYVTLISGEQTKHEYLSTLGYVDQYPMEGGQHVVSDEFRAKEKEKISKVGLNKSRLERVRSAIEYLTGNPFMGTEVQAAPKPEVNFATLGEQQTDLVDAIKLGLKPTLDYIDFNSLMTWDLNSVYSGIQDLLPENLKLVAVTESDVIASRPDYPVNGWFHIDAEGNPTIYIDVTSGTSVEVIVHELLHAALATTIRDAKTNDNSKASQFVDELEKLRTKLLASKPDSKFDAALESVDELLSWGLTNTEFRDYLKTITFASSNKGSITSALREFLDVIKIYFFGITTPENQTKNNALEAVIINFVGLTEVAESSLTKAEQITLAMAKQNQRNIMSYTTQDIYDALGKAHNGATGAFDFHMRSLLAGIVHALRGPFGSLSEADMNNQTVTPLDVWNKSMATGQAPLASKIGAANLIMSEQERFVAQQIEAVMQDAVSSPEATVSAAMQELIKLHNFAKNKLSPKDFVTGDWVTASIMEQQEATHLYDLMFNAKLNQNGKSDYLATFVALGLGNKKIFDALSIPAQRAVRKSLIGKDINTTLSNIFEFILNLYSGLATRTTGNLQINEKIMVLTNRLVEIEARKKNTLIQRANAKVGEPLDVAGQKIVSVLKASISKLLKSHFIRNNKFGTVQGVGAIARIFLEDRIPDTLDLFTKARNEFDKSKHSMLMNMMNDVRGYGPRVSAMVRNATALNAEREHIANGLGKAVLGGFLDNGSYLSDEDHRVVTSGLLRTGAYTLLDNYSMADLSNLLSDDSYRTGEIKSLEKQLIKAFGKRAFFFIKQSKGLGFHMISGKSALEAGQLKNALVISKEALSTTTPMEEAKQKQAEKIIDQLVTLYAFDYMGQNKSKYLSTLVNKENSRTNGNGFAELLSLHHKLNIEAKERLFSDSPELMVKGYLPEIINPHTSFKVTTLTEGKELIKQDYEQHSGVFIDSADPSSDKKQIYVLKDGAPMPYVSGAIQLDSNKSKGTNAIGSNRNLNMDEGILNASDLASVNNTKRKLLAQMYSPASLQWDPRKEKGNYLIPLLNPNMEVVNWRYEMSHQLRDSILERDNRIDQVMGTMAATSFGKDTAKEQNKVIVDALALDYKENYVTNQDHFIFISNTSSDKELQEIWRLLPYAMKEDIRNATGSNKGIWVRKKYVLPLFGFRKYSLSGIWEKDTNTLNHAETAFKWVVEHMLTTYAIHSKGMFIDEAEEYGRKMAYIVTRRGQRGWEEVVSLVKDVVVIRTGTVMLGNIISNISLLKANGVPLSELMKNHHVAIKAYRQWDANSTELFDLKLERDLGFIRGDAARKEQRIVQLEDAINRSPIKKLIDFGLRPSIVEDLSEIDDKYSYKSNFSKKVEGYVNRVNPTVRDVANTVLVTRNSKLYKALSKTTQMSDFVARYVLFEHLTKRAKNPMLEKDAVHKVSEAFINYDVPMDKKVQFMDDMGFIPFIKYFFRIQRVLLETTKEHPLQMLGLVALNHFYSSLPLVTDSSFLAHIGNNPFRMGAGQIFTVWDDTLVLDSMAKLIK